MAEGVLFNIAVSILKTLGSLLVQEIVLLWGLNDELEKLQRTVSTIKAVLLDAEKQYSTRNEVKQWLDDLRDGVYDAEDLLGEISAKASRLQRMSGNKLTKEVRLLFSRSNRAAYGLKMAHEIKDVRAKLDAIAENRKFHLNPNHTEVSIADHLRDVGTHSSPPSLVIGRDDDRKRIISLLRGDHPDAVAVIPIVGFGGLGKTTLAQTIYNAQLVKTHFDLRIWVCVSDIFVVRSIVEKIVECVDGEKPNQNLEVETLTKKLFERTKEKKYFLVLDDVWNEDREKWLQLYHLIVGGARGSRVVITTRSTKVAEITSTMQPYQLKGLSKEESWDLFQQVAFKQGKAPNEEFEVTGKEIARKCCGLPLAIRTIGSLLYSRNEVSRWKYFSDEEFSKLDPNSQMVETLKLSYNHLPSNLKQCFSYCSLFPKDYLFEVPTLINHWRAQGYIDHTTMRGPNDEDFGATCFKYLLQGSFFQLADENEFGDKVTCRMHDFMHDLAVLVSGEESNMVYPHSNQKVVTGKTRHISLHEIPMEQQWQKLTPLLQRQKARTLIIHRSSSPSYGFIKSGDKQSREVVGKLRSLRVLTLQRCLIYKLPNLIGRLSHLAHLDLSGNRMQKLPDSITRLWNLQVLILDNCYELRKLPRDINMLVNLIHIGLERCHRLKGMPRGMGQLNSLEVLSRFNLSNNWRSHASGRLDELQKLSKLRGKLKIVNLGYVKKGAWEFEAANLKEKHHLRYLSLEWGEDHVVVDMSSEENSLEALEPHVNLMKLRLKHYRGVRFPRWVASLENLVHIRIIDCTNCKFLSPLDELPCLQHLFLSKLLELEYIIDNNIENTKETAGSHFFPSLKELTLNVCRKLKGWWRSTDEQLHYQLPCLSTLKIGQCPKFKGRMPLLPSLKNLDLIASSSAVLEETLKQAKPSLASTSTSLSPLKKLLIREIGGLGSLREEALQGLASLKVLKVMNFADTSFLAQWLHLLPSLEKLAIGDSEEMNLFEENNTELIQFLEKLRSLILYKWKEMKSLPKWIQHLTSLKTFSIYDCPYLSERCGSNRGEDWSFISHIPNILVDDVWVQIDGSYQL